MGFNCVSTDILTKYSWWCETTCSAEKSVEIKLNWAPGRAGPEAAEPDRPAEARGGGEEEEGGRGGRREGEAKVSDSI